MRMAMHTSWQQAASASCSDPLQPAWWRTQGARQPASKQPSCGRFASTCALSQNGLYSKAHPSLRGRRCSQRSMKTQATQDSGSDKQGDTPFGYTRKDIILLGVGIIAFGYALYYGLQAFFGVDALVAGNYVQLFVFLGIGVGYISTYIFRVANKEMTYVKQLEDYEEAVMKKRLEEMPQAEKERLLLEIEAEKDGKKTQQGKP